MLQEAKCAAKLQLRPTHQRQSCRSNTCRRPCNSCCQMDSSIIVVFALYAALPVSGAEQSLFLLRGELTAVGKAATSSS